MSGTLSTNIAISSYTIPTMPRQPPGPVEFIDDTSNPFLFNGIQRPGWVYQTLKKDDMVYGVGFGWCSIVRHSRHPPDELAEYISSEQAKCHDLEREAASTPGRDNEDEVWTIMARAALAEHRIKQVMECLSWDCNLKVWMNKNDEVLYDEEGYDITNVAKEAWREVWEALEKVMGKNGDLVKVMEEMSGKKQS